MTTKNKSILLTAAALGLGVAWVAYRYRKVFSIIGAGLGAALEWAQEVAEEDYEPGPTSEEADEALRKSYGPAIQAAMKLADERPLSDEERNTPLFI